MNVTDAIAKHRQWVDSFRYIIIKREWHDSQWVSTVSSDDQCELGKWLHFQAQTNELDERYKTALAMHKHFHHVAGNIASAIGKRDFDKAFEMVNKDKTFTEASKAVCDCIDNL